MAYYRLIDPTGEAATYDPYAAITDPDDPYCFVMVFPNDEEESRIRSEELREARLRIIKKLQEAGLLFSRQKSRDGDELFLKIRAPDSVLLRTAETLELRVALKRNGDHETGFAAFIEKKKNIYEGYQPDGTFKFRTKDKQAIIQHLVEEREVFGGAEIIIGEEIKAGNILQFFPVHSSTREELRNRWVHGWSPSVRGLIAQPLDDIRNYFGAKIALYFAFLGFYTKCLVSPALLGIGLTIAQWIYGDYDQTWIICVYAIYISIWSICFLELWKRENSRYAWRWDVYDYEQEEKARPEFKGELRISPITGKEELWYPEEERRRKIITSACFILFLILGVIAGMVSILILKNNDRYSSLAGVANGVLIPIFNAIYKEIALRLNEWENYRTDTEFEDALIAKVFLFQFCNSYLTLYIISFMKPQAHNFEWIKDMFGECACLDGVDTDENGDCLPEDRSCVNEVSNLLLSIFMIQLVIGNINEFAIPWLMQRRKIAAEELVMKTKGLLDKPMSRAEAESKLEPYSSPFDDYNELIIQFGYITFFASAFPMIGFFALVNNFVEIRSDANKLCRVFQRPEAKSAADIGTWYNIMEIMAFVSVTTNSAFTFYTSAFHYEVKESWGSGSPMWGFFISEHILFALKLLIAFIIPDVPEDVSIAMAQADYEQKMAFKAHTLGADGDAALHKVHVTTLEVERQDFYPSDDENDTAQLLYRYSSLNTPVFVP
eukprot:TRINITY_DN4257_c0_g1::TRINITY_DN4257_c0_g1_i1::g.7946::m.7946 TRINITY_DN4257_c0_g1::TRINITY_DN4257_c0_g1_i1::g.7946  ORF type:complete len:721 (+),score=181.50,sp/Q4V8U5/ANO10_DANRE/29.92/2e-68,Anoctamin/PF04547.7/8.4e-126 TRINITY_DN4257_c0_g1_i1:100-2262(+)